MFTSTPARPAGAQQGRGGEGQKKQNKNSSRAKVAVRNMTGRNQIRSGE